MNLFTSKRIELSAITVGFSTTFSAVFIKIDLGTEIENQFDYYKDMYVNLLNTYK